jgi:catechol 2,3-dioxygenase-like lactoylglutathione lyase family enzyme
MELKRIDHVGIVVASPDEHVAQLETLGLTLARTSESNESFARYYACGDASIEPIDVRDSDARRRRFPGTGQARIEHIAFEVDDLEEVRRLLEARDIEVSWPPFPSGTAQMIWTNAETSGGVQYQFLVRPAPTSES